ncbi:unnamed protein product, partial [Choristocarpus tenellus]
LGKKWVTHVLAGGENCGKGQDSTWRWSGMRLVDTVVLDESGKIESWIFTSKSGLVTSKRKAQNVVKMVERFATFALANPNNQEGYVALVDSPFRKSLEERIALDRMGVEAALLGPSMAPVLIGAVLQCFLRPRNGSNSYIRGVYTGCDQMAAITCVSPLYRNESEDGLPTTESQLGSDSEALWLRKEVEESIFNLVNFFQRSLSLQEEEVVTRCEIEFILDDNKELWLLSIPSVLSVRASPPTGENEQNRVSDRSDRNNPNGDVNGGKTPTTTASTMPTLGSLHAPLEGGDTPLGNWRVEHPRRGKTLASTAWSEHGEVQHKSESSALPRLGLVKFSEGVHLPCLDVSGKPPPIQCKGGIYVSRVQLCDLKGLGSWRKVYMKRTNKGTQTCSTPSWELVVERYVGDKAVEECEEGDSSNLSNLTVEERDPSHPSSFEELSKMRFKVTSRSILLAIATASFLTGEEPLHRSDSCKGRGGNSVLLDRGSGQGKSLIERWRESDHRAQLSLASADPEAYYSEATVCGNCMEICSKLDSIRSLGFGLVPEAHATASPSPRRPSSEPGTNISILTESMGTGSPSGDLRTTEEGVRGKQKLEHRPASATTCYGHSAVNGSENIFRKGAQSGGQSGKQGVPKGGGERGMQSGRYEGRDAVGMLAGNGSGTAGDERDGQDMQVSMPNTEGDEEERATASSDKIEEDTTTCKYGERGDQSNYLEDKIVSGECTPNLTLLARFALEREKLAREMGVEELAEPATSGVVHIAGGGRGEQVKVGKGVGERRRQKKSVKVEGSRLSHGQQHGNGNGFQVGGKVNEQGKTSGECLLEELEAVAEARAAQVWIVAFEASRDSNVFMPKRMDYADSISVEEGGALEGVDGGENDVCWKESKHVNLSVAEKEFLNRSRRQSIPGGEGEQESSGSLPLMPGGVPTGGKDSLFGNHFTTGFLAGGMGKGEFSVRRAGVSFEEGGVATIGALRERLSEVEAENKALRARARKAEEERADEAVKAERARKKFAQARGDFIRAMSEKDEDHCRRELALGEQHSRELAQRSHQAAEELAKPAKSGGSEEVGVDGRESTKGLIARLESAHLEMGELQQRFINEKRALLAQKGREVAAVEAKARQELQEALSISAALEDRGTTLQEQVAEAVKQISTLKAKEEEQRKRRQLAEEAAEEARKEVGILRQTVQQTMSMDVQNPDGRRMDGKSAVAAITATSEARIRTLNNKVEFLKAQLASEQTFKKEVEERLVSCQKKVQEGREGARKQALEAERQKELAVEATVTRMKQQMEESLNESFRLQSKVQVLQDQLNDALGDTSLARHREEAVKAEMAQIEAKLQDKAAELVKAQTKVEELIEEATSHEPGSGADRAASEAVIRRLDNERQYLKSQLESEITCRDELRTALATATRQLGEVKVNWAKEQEERSELHKQEVHKLTETVRDLSTEKVSLEAELVGTTKQLELLREGYTKARDQLRAEQLALETARTANRRLREEVLAAAEEIASARDQRAESQARHSESLRAAQAALDEGDQERRKQAAAFQTQLREKFLAVGELQRQLIDLRSEMA